MFIHIGIVIGLVIGIQKLLFLSWYLETKNRKSSGCGHPQNFRQSRPFFSRAWCRWHGKSRSWWTYNLAAERKRHRDPVTTDLLGALLAVGPNLLVDNHDPCSDDDETTYCKILRHILGSYDEIWVFVWVIFRNYEASCVFLVNLWCQLKVSFGKSKNYDQSALKHFGLLSLCVQQTVAWWDNFTRWCCCCFERSITHVFHLFCSMDQIVTMINWLCSINKRLEF